MGGCACPGARGFLSSSRECGIERAANNRLNAFGGERLGEFERPEKIVAVGDRERWLSVRGGKLGQRLDGQRAFEQRVGGMDVEVNETGRGHGLSSLVFC